MDIPELVGSWVGPSSTRMYIVPILNKIILIESVDRAELLLRYGEEKLPLL